LAEMSAASGTLAWVFQDLLAYEAHQERLILRRIPFLPPVNNLVYIIAHLYYNFIDI
jgi:hypothetical protein